MNENAATGLQNSGTSTQYRQSLTHLQIAPSANGDPTCQVCGDTITDGEAVTLYLSRPAGRAGYTVDQCRCSEHNEDLTSLFTLGVRELVIDGRIGHYHSHDTQRNCPVLLTPSIRVISSPDTKTGRVVGDHTETYSDIPAPCRASDCKSNTADTEGTLQSVLPFADLDGTVDTRGRKSIGGSVDG